MKRITDRVGRRKRGSVLLLIVFLMAVLSLFSLSSVVNTRTMVDMTSSQRGKLQVELVAESALAYTTQQLWHDQAWAGTPTIETDFGTFAVTRDPASPPLQPRFILTAWNNEHTVRLAAEFALIDIDSPVIDQGLAMLGGSADFNEVELHGDLLVVDTEGGVADYDPVLGEWDYRTTGGDPLIESNGNIFHGDVLTTSGSSIAGPGTTVGGLETGVGTVVNPTWNLDHYLVPNPDTIIMTDVSKVRKLTTDKTVVIVNQPGMDVDFNNCEIGGGVVVWSPPGWPQRGPARNGVSWTDSTFGTPDGGSGTHRNVGVIAPASRLFQANASNPGFGLFYFHEIEKMNDATLTGALWVVNAVGQLNNLRVTYDADLANHDFLGFEGEFESVKLLSVQEHYPTMAL